MNSIKVFEAIGDQPGMPSPTETRSATRPGSGSVFTLRKSGSRPVSFSGRHLGQHNGYRVGTALWHELNLYQIDDGRFVADIRVFCKAPGSKDQFHVRVVETLEEALQIFESYDARQDVAADFDLDDPDQTPAELMVQAAALRYRIAEAAAQYRAVVASFLQSLNNG